MGTRTGPRNPPKSPLGRRPSRARRPRHVRAAIVGSISALVLGLSGCSIFRLGQDLELLYAEATLVPGQVDLEPTLAGQPIVLLARAMPAAPPIPEPNTVDGTPPIERLELVDYRFPDGQQRFNFQARTGDYRLMVFLDQNGDFVHQPGEPVYVQPGPAFTNRLDTRRGNFRFNILEVTRERVQSTLPFEVDLTSKGLQNMPRTATTMGVPIDFDDYRFNDRNIALGMWEPTRWFTQVDYGFYLFGDWNPSLPKPMILLVHGINGSPRDFEAMLDKIDTSAFKVALFHYPSGISLDDNAYMLAQTMNELQIRTPGQSYVLIAHSMGGLVAKRFIELQEQSGRSDLIDRFITISTPWDGHRAAAAGAKHSPIVAPVWKDLAPGSRFIRELEQYALPPHLEYTMIFGYGGNNPVLGEANDGAVSLDSQLSPSMQDRADTLIGVSQDHVGILPDDRTIGFVGEILDGVAP